MEKFLSLVEANAGNDNLLQNKTIERRHSDNTKKY